MTAFENLVPKVHPATREVESEDPMELVATPIAGDADVMLECIMQEFAWMGWDEEKMMELFHSSAYPVLGQLRQSLGEDEIRFRIRNILARQGAFRVQETIDDAPEAEEPAEPELIQIGRLSEKGTGPFSFDNE
jgi:hypothetical protein